MVELYSPSDCQSCGACCINKKNDKLIEVGLQESKMIPGEMLQKGVKKRYAMKQNQDGSCIALRGKFKSCYCSIYYFRPKSCREFKKDSASCYNAICEQVF